MGNSGTHKTSEKRALRALIQNEINAVRQARLPLDSKILGLNPGSDAYERVMVQIEIFNARIVELNREYFKYETWS